MNDDCYTLVFFVNGIHKVLSIELDHFTKQRSGFQEANRYNVPLARFIQKVLFGQNSCDPQKNVCTILVNNYTNVQRFAINLNGVKVVLMKNVPFLEVWNAPVFTKLAIH